MSIKRVIALLLCAVLILLCVWQITRVPSAYQYVLPAPSLPEEKQPSETENLLTSLADLSQNWTGIIQHYAVTAHASGVSFTGSETDSARLTGEYGSPAALPYRILTAGRTFYDHELENGSQVILLDEQLAIALFRVGDPIGRTVTLGQHAYTVIGVVRHTRAAGEKEAYGAYVPLLSLEKNGIQAETLTIWAKGVDGAGAFSQFKNDMSILAEKGSLYNLSQERARALLPLWLAGSVCLMLIVISVFRAFGRLVMRLYRDYLQRLEHCFAVQLVPRLLMYAAISLLALSAAIALFYGFTQLLMIMVNIFPEWIPAVPVEINDILFTWWQNVETSAGAIEWRSGEIMTLRKLSSLLRLPSLAFTLLFTHAHGMLRSKSK